MRTIKKIAALALGATMIGATIMGAMAADLTNYPKPFVDGCTFSGAIVVGEKAAAEDVVGAIDIASTLAGSGTGTGTGTGVSVTPTGEAVKIETSTDKLNIGDNITEVMSVPIDEGDLPTILQKQTYTANDGDEFDYKQKLTFNPALEFSQWADSDYKDKEPSLGVKLTKNNLVVTYELDFTKDAESDVVDAELEDIEDSTINMLGNTYDIVDADNATNIKLDMMGGAIRDILEQGQSKTYKLNDKDYEVEVTYLGESGNIAKAKFKLNGEVSDTLEAGDTWKTADGTTIGVRDILLEKAGEVTGDQVEFYLGAEKLTLESTKEIKLNDVEVDNVVATITATFGTTTKIDKIEIAWTADEDLFVAEGNSVALPGLGSFKLDYQGLTTVAEENLKLEGSDKVLELTAEFEDGKYTMDLLGGNGTVFNKIGGDGADEGLPTVANPGSNMMVNITPSKEDQYFVVTYYNGAAGGESYLLEIGNVDATDGVSFKNVITGDLVAEDVKNASTAFSVGSATLTMKNFVDDQWVNITGGATTYFDRIITKEGLTIRLPINSALSTVSPNINLSGGIATTYVVYMEEEDKDGKLANGDDINVTAGNDITNLKVKINTVASDPAGGTGTSYNGFEIGDTDEYEGYVASELGTKTLYDAGPDQPTFELFYHGEQVYGNVYVAASETGFGKAAGGTETVCRVSIPPAMLDSEVSDVATQNMILVGGPCANKAAATVMGVANTIPECLAGFTEGKAMIKLYDTGSGKVAMLVAGATALDTRRASRVLANYKDYALSGSEVEVTGTSLTDITVKKVA
jgi:hypothetical protein